MVLVVHRDLEPKHLGLGPDGGLCLFDLSSAVPLPGGGSPASGTRSSKRPATTSHYAGESESKCLFLFGVGAVFAFSQSKLPEDIQTVAVKVRIPWPEV